MRISAADILNASILIVDDQASNVSLLERLLREAGYACIASTMNPHEVCALHRKNRYDLILLDLQMPGMDGFQVMEGLKTDDADGYLPVIVLTAQPGHKLRALQAGARDFISKPFDLVEVKTRIHNLLEVRLLYKSLETYNKMLKRLDRMKSEFVSTVSHELRAPLTSIRGSLGVLASGVAGPLPDRARGFIEIAQNNCERLIRLIADVLDIEKIESGQISFALRPLDLMELIDQTVQADEGFAAQHSVRLQVVAAQPGAKVHADPDRLAQVMTNLISNACKFSPPGSTVDIAVTRERGRLKVTVADCGPGISEEFLGRIFQRFSQADSSDARQKGGTGLGLSISKAIVERLGGEIGFTTANPGLRKRRRLGQASHARRTQAHTVRRGRERHPDDRGDGSRSARPVYRPRLPIGQRGAGDSARGKRGSDPARRDDAGNGRPGDAQGAQGDTGNGADTGHLHDGQCAAERDPACPEPGRDRRHSEAFRPHDAVGAGSGNLAKTRQLKRGSRTGV